MRHEGEPRGVGDRVLSPVLRGSAISWPLATTSALAGRVGYLRQKGDEMHDWYCVIAHGNCTLE